MMSPSSSYGSIAISSNLTSSSSESNSSIHDGVGSSTTSTLLRRRRSASDAESSRFFFTAYSANYSILFLLTLTTVIFFAPCSRQHQWYQGIPLLLRSSSKKKCKTLYLLRHAKSSWVDSSYINDYDRQLSPQGRKVAHVVGKSLHKNKHVDVPDVILASPSVRTRETLDVVLAAAAWGRKFFDDESSKILYSKSWYDLSDEGYLNHLVYMLSDEEEEEDISKEETSDQGNTSDHGGSSIATNNTLPIHNIFSNANTIMIVGHNPAIERLLNDLLTSPNDDEAKQQWHHYSPGHFYAVRFPTLERWSDLGAYIEEGRRGVVELHLPE